jgi:hypothetical protein
MTPYGQHETQDSVVYRYFPAILAVFGIAMFVGLRVLAENPPQGLVAAALLTSGVLIPLAIQFRTIYRAPKQYPEASRRR